MLEHLFVYGTLGPGRPNEHVLGAIKGEWRNATVRGYLREAGWGAAMGFPGLDLAELGDVIEGFVFSSGQFASLWNSLDAFEGEAYQRVITAVTLADDSRLDAYIYTLKPEGSPLT